MRQGPGYNSPSFDPSASSMDTTNLPTITIAGSPFNDPSDGADVVIRTADNVDFFVLKALLSLNSPSSFFRHALQASHHTEERDGLPVLEVKEDSSTFRTILLFCYPYKIPEIKDFAQFTKVGMALDKYCIDNALERFIEAVLASSVIKDQPVRVFSVAVANGWKELAETAARNTLAMPLEPEVEFKEFRHINALQHFRLREYHRKCGKVVQDVCVKKDHSTKMLWLGCYLKNRSGPTLEFLQSNCLRCQRCQKPLPFWIDVYSREALYSAHRWLGDYLDSVAAQALQRPVSGIAPDEDIILRAIVASMSECVHDVWAKIAASQVRLFGKLLAEEIDKRISEVPLNMEWTK
ncbi:hypothetical protein ARMSODRAFT_948020 [Armillaria solidipes]|uniref:BTB domain-containing protein n=1 Tax=Armillaria solidipes TaxID=1076256 RepID=A0A2H3C4K7_9AGAR|nr:hypothetical protein ARMSODRAFT_948020 [Armillaria solidipes]